MPPDQSMSDAPEMESAPEQGSDNPQEEQAETASLPIDFCPNMTPKEGDVLSVKVVSVDADNGSMDVVYQPSEMKPANGIKAAAKQFDQKGAYEQT